MKPDLILLHGALGSENNFDSLKVLLSENYTVHSFSFRGHGKTGIVDEFSIKNFVEDLSEFYRKHKIEKAFLFGYSMGGYVALSFALQNPDKVLKIFTYGTKFDWNPEIAKREAGFLKAKEIEEKFPKFANSLKLQYEDNWTNVVEKTASMMLRLGDAPVMNTEAFRAITVPVRIGWGSKDQMVSLDESKTAYESLTNSELEIFEDWPHPISLLDYVELALRIKEYFI